MNQKTLDFIREHADEDIRQLALRGSKDPEVDMTFALDQIAGRQKARTKLPGWAAVDGIVYPSHLSMEQCSSELTAKYKAAVIASLPDVQKGRLADLTGGFGVDFFWMAQAFSHPVYVERQPALCALSSENFKTLGLEADVVNADGVAYLHDLDRADVLFLDPARRDIHGARTYGIADCTPDVLMLKDELLAKSGCLLLKLSPMLDWKKAVADLGSVCQVHIVSVENECKELLLVVSRQFSPLRVVCVNLFPDGREERFEFDASSSLASFTPPSPSSRHYLFEPNASLMKAGCFNEIGQRFGLHQLSANSHLFTGEADVADFPGRRFAIEKVTTMNKRDLREALQGITSANIAVRNFPLSVADLRKRLKLKDGGSVFLFATTVAEEGHLLFVCRKIG